MPNVEFLYGDDEFAIARRLNEFMADFPDASSAEMNITRLDAAAMSDGDLNNAVNAMPFLAEKRLVILANPSVKYDTPEARKKFRLFLEATPDSARLILHEIITAREAKDHWLVKWASKNASIVKTQSFVLPARDMTGWIVKEARTQGGEIERTAAARLAEMVGADTRQAAQEIAKLLAYANWARPIGVSDVEQVSIFTAQQSIFDFVDALALADGKRAQALLHHLLDSEEWFALWGMVLRQFRLLLQAREILDGRGNQEDVVRLLHVHPYVAEKATNQARRFSITALEGIYRRLLEIDEGVKTGQFTLDLALDLLVVELAN
jgi:DNA polymerase-3 subunit delta